jgi:TonB family protein
MPHFRCIQPTDSGVHLIPYRCGSVRYNRSSCLVTRPLLNAPSPTRVQIPRPSGPPVADNLALLPAIEPWGAAFRSNLKDFLLRPEPPLPPAGNRPGKFWSDVFVSQPLPWRRFAESAGYHALLIAALYGISILPSRPAIAPAHAFDKSQVLYFNASEYLPPLDTGDLNPASERKADPEFAKQPILSVPPEARNNHQTIVAPPNVQLDRDIDTPNIVAWGDHSVPVPVSATERAPVSLASLNTPILAPPPTAVERKTSAPSLDSSVIAPPPPTDVTGRRLRDINLAPSAIIAPAPAFSVDAQRVPSSLNAGNAAVVPPPPSLDSAGGKPSAHGARASLASNIVPPPPSTGGTSSPGGNRVIALGIHPAVVPPPAPTGNRQGAFAANPEGKVGASGAPGTTGTSTHGTGTKASLHGVPAGLQVGAAGSQPTTGVAGDPHSSASNTVNPNLLAKVSPPPSVPRGATSPALANELERKVFGDRPFYSMTLNMPNLNSAGGSWIMRFAELNDSGSTADISAPRALHKVDPAYPLELMRQNVGGTVALRAIIRSDGSVADVHVLRSIDARLDRYACDALARWQFEPATRSGAPVDLAVVVMIPFHPVSQPHF